MLFIPRDHVRQVTHALMAFLSVGACLVAYALNPEASFARILTIGLGYLALAQLAFALLVGPAQLILKSTLRRNPANIMLRRDVGIWVGINGLLHVVFGLQVHRGGDIVQYFFERAHAGWQLLPVTNVFGFSNYTGGLATIFMLLLLIISNDLSMKILRGPVWKWVQRTNYVMAALVVAHTFGYQVEVQRPPIMIIIVAALTLLTMAAQMMGVAISLARRTAQAESKGRLDRGCVTAVGVSVITPILFAACVAGVWLYAANRAETHEPPVHETPPPMHETAPPQHETPQHPATPVHNAP